RDYAIIGITPPGFTGVDVNAVDVWVPVSNYQGGGGHGGEPWYSTFGTALSVLLRVNNPAEEEHLADQATNAARPIEMKGCAQDRSSKRSARRIGQRRSRLQREWPASRCSSWSSPSRM